MKNLPFIICGLVTFLLIACEKKKIENVTSENLTELLTRYGKENPETEVLIETDFGNIRLKLYEDTPLHRANFVKLIKEGHYEDGEFYRIFYQFMIQGGDFNHQLDYMIPAEFRKKHSHQKGALSMARQDDATPE